LLAAQSLLLVINVVGVLSANSKLHLAIVLLALVTQVFGFGAAFFAFGPSGSG
jgi:hypothetical protein